MNRMTVGPRHRGRLGWLLVITAALLLALLWDWDWFRPLVERQASAALGRAVTLQRFDVELGRYPRLTADGLAVANPPDWPSDGHLLRVEHVAVRVDPWAWFNRRWRVVEIEIQRPDVDLVSGADGRSNYRLPVFAPDPSRAVNGPPDEPLTVDIGRLRVSDGHLRFVDPALKSDFDLRFRTRPQPASDEDRFEAEADGRYAGSPITARFVGGSVLGLRDAQRPYPVDLRLRNGRTQVRLAGSLIDPLRFGGADLRLDFNGDNLADLYPLTGVPLPPSPPYQLTGRLDYADGRFRFREIAGRYGQSDIAGEASVAPARGGRRQVRIDAHSDRVVWRDLAGLIGGRPGPADVPDDTPAQRSARPASGKLLPDKPIALPRIRAADLDVHYRVDRIESQITPVDRLEGHLQIEDGLIRVRPLKLGVGKGSVVANIELDGRRDPIRTTADIDFRQLDFSRIVDKLSAFRGSGTVGGSARIDTVGNSMAAMLGAGNGELKLFMAGGDISALLVHLAGLDLGNSLISALGLPRRADLRCLVADFDLTQGRLDTRTLLADTTEANVIGSGSVNFASERIDYRIRTQPKRLNVGRLGAPIEISGDLRNPRVRPDTGALALRGGAAVVLGTLLTPLAALIPTIQLGLGQDNDCVALLRDLQQPGPAPASSPDPAPRKPVVDRR